MVYFILVIYMTKVYVVRHCETEGNLKHIFQGHSDLPVTETGEKQLQALSEYFKDIYLDKIYHSPLPRTLKTGMAIRGVKTCDLIPFDGLIEINGGVYEGKNFLDIFNEFPGFKDMWSNHPQDFAPENGETMRDAYERIWQTVKNLAQQNKGKTIACATHGGVIRCLLCRFLKGDIEKLSELDFVGNTAVSIIEFDDDFVPTLTLNNSIAHLPDTLLNQNAAIPTGDK